MPTTTQRNVHDDATTATYADTYADAYTGPVDLPRMAQTWNRNVADTAGASAAASGQLTNQVPLDPQGGVHLRLWDLRRETLLALLPQYSNISASLEFNDDGNIKFDYPVEALGADALLAAKSGLIELFEGNVLVQMGVYDQDSEDPADRSGSDRAVGITAPGTLSLLNWALVYPELGFNTHQYATFQNVTPGSILTTLLARAQARGTLDGSNGPWVWATFTATQDSAGNPWPLNVWFRYDAGKSLRDVVADLEVRGFVDTRMRGLQWDVYVKDTYLAPDHPSTFIRLNREVTGTPRRRERAPIRTALLMTGDGNLSTEVASTAEQIDTYGRREGFSGQSGVSNGAILQLVGQQTLDEMDSEREGFTATYDRSTDGPVPFVDYDLGHFLRADWYRDPNTGLNLPVRVRTMTMSYDANGVRSAELELNDLFLERDILMKRRVDALTNGSVSTATAPPTPVAADSTGPNPPSDVFVTSNIIVNADGRARAVAVISWPLVTSNTDATLFDDDGGYHVSWSVDGSDFTAGILTEPGAGVAYAVGLPPGATFIARVAASDYNGHVSGYTTSAPVTLLTDVVAPPPPSKPTVTAFIGSLNVTWDGLDSTGHVMPGDFDHVEAWVATTNDPGWAVRRGPPLVASGTIPITGLTYGVPYFVWLRSVDRSGNPTAGPPAGFSVVADTAGTAPTQVLSPDLGGGAVGPNAFMYRDFDNKVPDGSFESASNRARLQSDPAWGGVWSFVQSGSDGGWSLQGDATVGPGTVRKLPLITGIEVLASDKVWFTFKAKGSSGASGQAQLVLTVRDGTGAVISTQTLSVSTADGTWQTPVAGSAFTYTFPANASTYDVAVQLSSAAQLGTWSFDAVQVRQVIQTAVIDQAAIGNAQIQILAVDEAQIQHVQVEDILAGQLTASYIALAGGRLTTTAAGQQSGARVELDSLGLRAYDSSSTSSTTGKTVEIKSDGSAQISGTIVGGGLVGGTITGSLIQTNALASAYRVTIGEANPLTSNIDGITFHPGTYLGHPEATWSPAVMYVGPNTAADGTHSYGQLVVASGKTRAGAGAGQAQITLDPQFGGLILQMTPDVVSNPGQTTGQLGLDTNGLFRLSTSDISWDNSGGFRSLGLLYGGDYAGIETQSGGLLRLFSIGGVYAQKLDHSTYSPFTCLSLTQTSSREIKAKVERLDEPMLVKVRAIDPHRYVARGHEDDGWRVGFIAEHVEALLPELTRRTETEDATLGFDVGGMVSVLWRAVQELDADVKGRVEALEARVAALGSPT